MTDDRELLAIHAAVLACPEDDLPRLAYADRLDEAGTCDDWAYATFIRTQIEMERLREGCSCGKCVSRRLVGGQHTNGGCVLDRRENRDLRVREKMLLTDEGGFAAWTSPVYYAAHEAPRAYDLDVKYRAAPAQPLGLRFRRGFIDMIRAPMQTLYDHGRAIARLQPVTRYEASDRTANRDNAWYNAGRYPTSKDKLIEVDDLPHEVWVLLAGYVDESHLQDRSRSFRTYPSQDEAQEALRRAILEFCTQEKRTA